MSNISKDWRKIIACDFDGTMVTDDYPQIGEPIEETIRLLKKEQAHGARIILWTNRTGDYLKEAVKWCEEQGIVLSAVNDNIQEVILAFKNNCRKIFAHEYWDDRSVYLPHLSNPENIKEKTT